MKPTDNLMDQHRVYKLVLTGGKSLNDFFKRIFRNENHAVSESFYF
jgi:hypothetical protein